MKNLLLLFQPHIIFNKNSGKYKLGELGVHETSEFLSILMNDNFVNLRNSKKYKVDLSVDFLDSEILPGVYSTVNTELHIRNIPESHESELKAYSGFNSAGSKRIIAVMANAYDLGHETLEFYFKALDQEDKRFILGFTKNGNLSFAGSNGSYDDLMDVVLNYNLNKERLLRKVLALNSEIIIANEGAVCNDYHDLTDMIKLYKKNSIKSLSSALVLFFNSIINNHKV